MTDLRVDPEIRHFLDLLAADWRRHPPLAEMPIVQARLAAEQVRARWAAGGPVMAETRNLTVPTSAGPVPIRVYYPEGLDGAAAPALVYLHGGGFVFFSLATHDRLMREYAAAGGFVVIGVDYPLSPEARYPVALDHTIALLRWLGEDGLSIGIDGDRLAIGGDSAGANLATAACLRLRDAGEAGRISGVLSNYGAFSGRCSDAAEAEYGGPAAVLTQAEMAFYFAQYLASADQMEDPLACPLEAHDLAGLPPVFLVIPELDVLTEQSLVMAERLAAAGVDVSSKVYRGATHSFLEAMSIAAVARAAIADGATWVADRLAG